jgi:hypothetical protein
MRDADAGSVHRNKGAMAGETLVSSFIFIYIIPCMIHPIHEVLHLSLSTCIHLTAVSKAFELSLCIPFRTVGRLRRLGPKEAISCLIHTGSTLPFLSIILHELSVSLQLASTLVILYSIKRHT